MYLEESHIENFRSISTVHLRPCGAFNVLIGKNNSGKSNLLASIDAFFQYVSPDIITLNPELGQEIDFFQKDQKKALILRSVFLLNDDERALVIADIESERPQLRNALDAVPKPLRLAVTIQIKALPDRYAFIKNISALKEGTDGQLEPHGLIFDLSEGAAGILRQRASDISRAQSDKSILTRFLRRFDSDDFQTARRGDGPFRGVYCEPNAMRLRRPPKRA
jgi:putative ATP-dependent endonuclease of OLD family